MKSIKYIEDGTEIELRETENPFVVEIVETKNGITTKRLIAIPFSFSRLIEASLEDGKE